MDTMTPWDSPAADIRADLEAAAEIVRAELGAPLQPTEWHCSLGHRLVLCIGDGALVEHVKDAHPDEARELGWLPEEADHG